MRANQMARLDRAIEECREPEAGMFRPDRETNSPEEEAWLYGEQARKLGLTVEELDTRMEKECLAYGRAYRRHFWLRALIQWVGFTVISILLGCGIATIILGWLEEKP